MRILKTFSIALAAVALACLGIYGAGTTVNGTRVINGDLTIKGTCTGCGGGAPAFSAVTSGTNSSAEMVVASGASLVPSTGLVAANLFLPNSATGAPAASIPLTGWTIQNTANAHGSYDDFSSDELVMTAGNFNTLEWSAITRTISVPYTLYARIETRGFNQQVDNFVGGLCLSDGTKYESFEVIAGSSGANLGLEVRTMTTLNAAGTNTLIAGPTVNVVGPTYSVKITNNSTNRVFSYWGGSAWVSFKSEATGTFLTETAAGTCLLDKVTSGGNAPEIALKYWSVQ